MVEILLSNERKMELKDYFDYLNESPEQLRDRMAHEVRSLDWGLKDDSVNLHGDLERNIKLERL